MSEYLEKKILTLNNEVVWENIKDSILRSLKMLSVQSTEQHARLLFDAIIPMIKKFFGDFKIIEVCQAIEAGGYGLYGDFTKMNPLTIKGWLDKKRLEIAARENKDEKRIKEDSIVPCKNGGSAVILGLFYSQKNIILSFKERMSIVEKEKICKYTGHKIEDIIKNYTIELKLQHK